MEKQEEVSRVKHPSCMESNQLMNTKRVIGSKSKNDTRFPK